MVKILFVLVVIINGSVDKYSSYPAVERPPLPGIDVSKDFDEGFMKNVFCLCACSCIAQTYGHHPARIKSIELLLSRSFIVNAALDDLLLCHENIKGMYLFGNGNVGYCLKRTIFRE